MNQLQILILRIIVGGIVATVLTRIFRPEAGVPAIIGLGVILVGLAYVFEYLRKMKQ